MNFLAHAYLSGGDKKILLGNFTGDFIKGRHALNQFEPDIIRGVELHRAIDDFTDDHPIVHRSKDRLRPNYRHYAAVIVDVFYDHYLAAGWSRYHPEPLEKFASDTYRSLEDFSSVLPPEFKRMFPYMKSGNWLVNYREVMGVHRTLSGMASRTPYESKMEHASEDLRRHYHEFKDEFEKFFPELKSFAQGWLSSKE